MQQLNFKEQVFPHLVAIVIFLLVTIAYFKPVFLDNKSLSQHDIMQWEGGAKELLDYRAQYGKEALWTNSMFGGMPGYLITTKWGIGVLSVAQHIYSVGLPHPVRIVFISFVSFYILLLVFKVRPYLAIAGALAFGLSSFNIIGLGAGHNARITAIAYMPLVLAGVHLSFSKSKLFGAALTAFALALELHANHLQITYYMALIIIAYLVIEGISALQNKNLGEYIKTGALLFAAALLALGTFIGSFMSTMEYSKYSIRGKSELKEVGTEGQDGLTKPYAFQYSNGIFEPMTLMIPNILGGSMQQPLSDDSNVADFMRMNGVPEDQISQQIQKMPTYWGDQPNTAPYYAGAIVCFLFILCLLQGNRKLIAWSIPLIILGILLSWGSNFSSFNYFMFDYFPGYNKFRSVTFGLIISILLMNLLGFISLEKIFGTEDTKSALKQVLIAAGLTGGLSLLLVMGAGLFSFQGNIDSQLPEWLINPLSADRKSLLQADAFRSFVFIALALGVIIAVLKSKLSASLASFIIVVLVLLDMWTIDKRYLNETNFTRAARRGYFTPTEADQVILKDKTLDYRVFNLANPWNDAQTSYYHKSIGGYHGAKLRRYQDLIDRCLDAEHERAIQGLRSSGILASDLHVLNMLNTKYLVAGPSAQAVIQNYQANGNAWLVSHVVLVDNPDQELDSTAIINTKTTAVIDQSFNKVDVTEYGGQGTITLTDYLPNELKYTAKLAGDGMVVFSEIYYPKGWQATIDGAPATILRANYVLRAMLVPSGDHEIVFSFKPSVYNYGNMVSNISSFLVILLLIGTLLIETGLVRTKS